jgi:hypothetical protein
MVRSFIAALALLLGTTFVNAQTPWPEGVKRSYVERCHVVARLATEDSEALLFMHCRRNEQGIR